MRRGKSKSKLKIKTSILIIGIVLLIFTVSVLGRYVYFHAKDRYLTSKSFYFSSDVLKTIAPTYKYTNWSGTDVYKIDIELYSFENELRRYEEDLEYTIKCTSFDTAKLNCTIDSQTGPVEKTDIIYAGNNTATVSIYVTPKVTLYQDEIFSFTVVASTDSPYSKTLSATYRLEIKAQGVGYEVKDEAYRSYLSLELKNTLDEDVDTTIAFDPSILRLDMNDDAYIQNKGIETTTINGSDYVKKVIFTMKGEASKNIKFYKVNPQQNYTGQTNLFTITK